MKLWALTHEKVQQLRDQHNKKLKEWTDMQNTTAKQLWLEDLDSFETMYFDYVKHSDSDKEKKFAEFWKRRL